MLHKTRKASRIPNVSSQWKLNSLIISPMADIPTSSGGGGQLLFYVQGKIRGRVEETCKMSRFRISRVLSKVAQSFGPSFILW